MMSAAPPGKPFEATNLRSVVGRFGGMVREGHAVAVPEQTWQTPLWGQESESPSPYGISGTTYAGRGGQSWSPDFNDRHKPTISTFGAGIPGYQGFIPHGRAPTTLFTNDREAMKPHEGMKALAAYDNSKQPTYMPPPGYMGHLRNTKENCFGTTAYKRGAHFRAGLKSWQSPDAPSSPEEERAQREADEANEILQLRSMGLREALKKNESRPMPKTRYNAKAY